jgi:hypothetical protein
MEKSQRTKRRRIATKVELELKGTQRNNDVEERGGKELIVDEQDELQLVNYVAEFNEGLDKAEKTLGRNSETGKHDLRSSLKSWAVNFNISHVALNGLLEVLPAHVPKSKLPCDGRKILKTPSVKSSVKQVCGEKYYHFGVSPILSSINLSDIKQEYRPLNELTLNIGIDGIPLSRSSNSQFWPILGVVNELSLRKVFIIGILFGTTKPTNINDFLLPFVAEFKVYETDGYIISNQRWTIRVKVEVADAPARSFVKNVKNHNAYSGCERFKVLGTWLGRIVYMDMH